MTGTSLDGYDRTTFTHDGKSRDVFRRGDGPAVVVIAEMPGITPKVVEFADRLVDVGCTAVVPHLFGEPGRDPYAGSRLDAVRYTMSSLIPTCISREFTVLATGRTSPVIDWLRALAADEHERCGGPGVGAVGMCFTGGLRAGDGHVTGDARPRVGAAVPAVRRLAGSGAASTSRPTTWRS